MLFARTWAPSNFAFGGIIAMATVVRRDRGGNSVQERCRCRDLMSKRATGCAALKQQPIAPDRRDAEPGRFGRN
jgi:hypothetical protein